MRVEAALALVDALDRAQPPRPEQRRDPGRPRPLAHAVEALAVLAPRGSRRTPRARAGSGARGRSPSRARSCPTCSRAAPGRRRAVSTLANSVGCSASSSVVEHQHGTSASRKRGAFAASVTSTFGRSRSAGGGSPRRRRARTSTAGCAPSFQVPKKIAAVSGVGGSTTATRSPRSTPCAASRFAAWFERSCSSPHVSSRRSPSKRSWTIASFSRGCLSQHVRGDVVALRHVPLVCCDGLFVPGHTTASESLADRASRQAAWLAKRAGRCRPARRWRP